MALIAGLGLFILEHMVKRIEHKNSMLALARMDMNWSIDDILNHCKRLDIAVVDSVVEEIRAKSNGVYTSKEFYRLLGFVEYDDIDYFADAGCTIVHDMNIPLPERYHQQFDFVSEIGTLEHIFDQKTVLGSMAQAVKVGGSVMHLAPLEALNHGFYNYSMNVFHDFYLANGFTDMVFYLLRHCQDYMKNPNIIPHQFPYTPDEFHIGPEIRDTEFNRLGLGFIAKKKKHFAEVQVPQQGPYDAARKEGSLRKWD